MQLATVGLTILVATVGAVAVAHWLYQLVLVVPVPSHRPEIPVATSNRRLAVLVPAHNDEARVAHCVRALSNQDRSPSLARIIVIADGCTDATVRFAAAAGAEVWERRPSGPAPDPAGAIAFGLERLLATPNTLDGVIVVGAGTLPSSSLLSRAAAAFDSGHDALLLEATAAGGDGPLWKRSPASVPWRLERLRVRGLARAGQSVILRGGGLGFSRRLLAGWSKAVPPWGGGWEVTAGLRLAGVKVGLVESALMLTAPAGKDARAGADGPRPQAGRRTAGPGAAYQLAGVAVRRRDAGLLVPAIELALPSPQTAVWATCVGAVLAPAVTAAGGVMPAAVAAVWVMAAGLMAAGMLLAWFKTRDRGDRRTDRGRSATAAIRRRRPTSG